MRTRTFMAVALGILVSLGPITVTAAAAGDPEPLREAAIRALWSSTEAAQPTDVLPTQRSMGRTVGGILLAGVGSSLLMSAGASDGDDRDGFKHHVGGDFDAPGEHGGPDFDGNGIGDADNAGRRWGASAAGGALIIGGALLATIWAEVPVARDVQVAVTPTHVQVHKTFGF